MFFLLGSVLCLGLLCAAPFTLDIQAGDRVSLRARYLWFTGNIPKRLRPAPSAAGFWRALRAWTPIFRQPRRIRRCRLNLLFSTGDAT
ncbi:MAG: hypothetical protein LBG10_07450, partial [Treponema sp.]|nr:hypothetical protein [Treponema sp.]